MRADGRQPFDTKKLAFALPYIAGRTYQVWWLDGLDWEHMAMEVDRKYDKRDLGILFKFPHLEERKSFDVMEFRLWKAEKREEPTGQSLPAIETCRSGDFYHGKDEKVLAMEKVVGN